MDLEQEHADIVRLLAIGIALTEGHTFSHTGPNPQDWLAGPQTHSQARERIEAYVGARCVNRG